MANFACFCLARSLSLQLPTERYHSHSYKLTTLNRPTFRSTDASDKLADDEPPTTLLPVAAAANVVDLTSEAARAKVIADPKEVSVLAA